VGLRRRRQRWFCLPTRQHGQIPASSLTAVATIGATGAATSLAATTLAAALTTASIAASLTTAITTSALAATFTATLAAAFAPTTCGVSNVEYAIRPAAQALGE